MEIKYIKNNEIELNGRFYTVEKHPNIWLKLDQDKIDLENPIYRFSQEIISNEGGTNKIQFEISIEEFIKLYNKQIK